MILWGMWKSGLKIGTGNIAAIDQPRVGRDGAATGQLKVTRGGSHGTEMYYLRSANRQAAVPSEKNWFIGFRVAADSYSEKQILAIN